MSRKLQAQRKFAQGAYIPGSNNLPERRSREEILPNEPKQIYYNNMPAKNLLDVLSFQNIHRHNQPVVLLERLSPGNQPQSPRNDRSMTLRKRKPNVNTNDVKVKKKRSQSPEFTKDDEKPLKFFKTKDISFNASTSKTTSVLSTKRKRDNDKELTEAVVLRVNYRLRRNTTRTKVIKRSKTKKSALKHSDTSPDNIISPGAVCLSKGNKTKSKDNDDELTEAVVLRGNYRLRRNTTRTKVIRSKIKKSPLKHIVTSPGNTISPVAVSLSKKNKTRSKVMKRSSKAKKAESALNVNVTTSPDINNEISTVVQESSNICYYGADGINEWMMNAETSTSTLSDSNNGNRFRVPLPPRRARNQRPMDLRIQDKDTIERDQIPQLPEQNHVNRESHIQHQQPREDEWGQIQQVPEQNPVMQESDIQNQQSREDEQDQLQQVPEQNYVTQESDIQHQQPREDEWDQIQQVLEQNHVKNESNIQNQQPREDERDQIQQLPEQNHVKQKSHIQHQQPREDEWDQIHKVPEQNHLKQVSNVHNQQPREDEWDQIQQVPEQNHLKEESNVQNQQPREDEWDQIQQVPEHNHVKQELDSQHQQPREEQTLETQSFKQVTLEQPTTEQAHVQLAHEQLAHKQRGHRSHMVVPPYTNTIQPSIQLISDVPIVIHDVESEIIQFRCPSMDLSTVREVYDAPKTLLDKRCLKCVHCHRVNKVFEINNLMERTRKPTDDLRDVPEADSVSDVTVSSTILQTQKNARSEQTIKPMYLDLLPHHRHIIEISTVKVPNRAEPIMQARLLNKSEVDTAQDLNLVEHENLFDQVLQTLDMSLQVPITEPVTKSQDDVQYIGDGHLSSDQQKSHSSKSITKTNKEPLPSKASRQKSASSRKSAEPLINKSQKTGFPKRSESSKCVDAPIFHPTEAEFLDPITYFEKIMPQAAKFGLCKVVPPSGFEPNCFLADDVRFTVTNQYIARLYSRWGPAAREMSAIKAYLATQGVKFTRAPLLDGVEVNLPKLYHIVQRYGGLKNVIEKKRWTKVAEELGLTKGTNPEKKLDQIYVRYLLPYDTLSNLERQQTISNVEICWNKKNNKMMDRALNPLHRQKVMLGESDSSEDESEEESVLAGALAEGEDCIVPGRSMNLTTFKKVSSNVMDTHMLTSTSTVTPATVEDVYWQHVLLGTEHVCVNTASIDTGEEGYGFTKNKSDPFGKHPWNLKMLSHNSGNVLRFLGSVLGVTIPTLHLGMLFSTSCWHRDPHGLPWIEYMHTGPGKIWYGIPNEESQHFRQAVETLCPAHCQNKQIWLSSDIIMIPPNLMLEQRVSLSKVVQYPGEFVIVTPKAYSSSICTGYTVSESVYFATKSWLNIVTQDFQEVRASCEPTMFSLEQLLIAAGRDAKAPLCVIQQIHSVLITVINNELSNRRALEALGVQNRPGKMSKKRSAASWNVREQDECEFCRATLYLSKVVGLPDKESSVCLHHALKLLETPKYKDRDLSGLSLVCFFVDSGLEYLINAIEKRLHPQKKDA